MSNWQHEAMIIAGLSAVVIAVTLIVQLITYHAYGKHIGYHSFGHWLNRTFEEEAFRRRHRYNTKK